MMQSHPPVPTIRLNVITHAQAIRLPGHQRNSVQIDGLDEHGKLVRVVLEPLALGAMAAEQAGSRRHFADWVEV